MALLPTSTRDDIERLARNGDTSPVLAVLRALAEFGWTGPMAEVIDLYARSVEINGPLVRRFLAHRVPGILANYYYNRPGREFYDDWIEFTLDVEPRWADPITSAAGSGSPEELERMVNNLSARVVAWVDAGRP